MYANLLSSIIYMAAHAKRTSIQERALWRICVKVDITLPRRNVSRGERELGGTDFESCSSLCEIYGTWYDISPMALCPLLSMYTISIDVRGKRGSWAYVIPKQLIGWTGWGILLLLNYLHM